MGRKYTKRTWTVEHSWTCGHCQQENPGRNDKCSNCGKPIDNTHQEHVPTDMSYENRVKDTTRFDDKHSDWFCSYCNHRNPHSFERCQECSAKQGEKKGDAVSGQDTTLGGLTLDADKGISEPSTTKSSTKYPTDNNEEPSHLEGFRNPNYQGPDPLATSAPSQKQYTVTLEETVMGPLSNATLEPSGNPAKSTKDNPFLVSSTVKPGMGYRDVTFEEPRIPTVWDGFKSWISDNLKTIGIFVVVGLWVLGIIGLCLWLFSWHDGTARVQETRWHYHVSLYQRELDQGHSWRDQEPAHSFMESCHTEVRSYHRCDPYDCNPHNVDYDCNCHSVEHCHPVEHCHNVCTSSGNRSSSCSEECEEENECEHDRQCSTCSRTEYDTCYHQCPDFDQMCDYTYPAWREISHADNSELDHTLIRPALHSQGDVACTSDDEELNIQNPFVTQCTVDSVDFHVLFDAGEIGHFEQHPRNLADYNRYQTGASWNMEYNHAGMFRAIGPR